jgi:hypothetical protein
MAIEQIIALLIAERDRIERAIQALGGGAKRPSGPPKKPVAIETIASAPKKRHVSAAARRKMAAAQKKRWAAIKAAK